MASSSNGSSVLFWPPWAQGTYVMHIPIGRQIFIYKNKKVILKKSSGILLYSDVAVINNSVLWNNPSVH